MTEAEYHAAVGGYHFLEKAAEDLAETYVDKFGDYCSVNSVHLDEIDGDITIEAQYTHCSGCGTDYYSYEIPTSYLYDPNWIEKEQAKRDEAAKKVEEAKAEKAALRKKELAEKRYQSYLEMKKEYEDE